MNLTPTEKLLLAMLADGYNYNAVEQKLAISRSSLHAHASNLKRKTGITDIHNRAECRQVAREYNPLLEADLNSPAGPTPAQLRMMRLKMQGLNYMQIAGKLGLSIGTVMNGISLGYQRIPGRSRGAQQREAALRAYLESSTHKKRERDLRWTEENDQTGEYDPAFT